MVWEERFDTEDICIDDAGRFFTPSSAMFVASLGKLVVAYGEFGDYTGDVVAVLHDVPSGSYGFLTMSYGSCSHCDSLLACSTVEELEDLQGEVERAIVWRNTFDEFSQFVFTRDWAVQPFGAPSEVQAFAKSAVRLIAIQEEFWKRWWKP